MYKNKLEKRSSLSLSQSHSLDFTYAFLSRREKYSYNNEIEAGFIPVINANPWNQGPNVSYNIFHLTTIEKKISKLLSSL